MWDEIITLWRTERSAVEAYEQALGERQWNQLQGRQVDRLVNILSDHLDAAAQLQAQIHSPSPNTFTNTSSLFAVLIVIESSDVMFAIDSIRANLAVTREPFLVFSSNAFAILGLRALSTFWSSAGWSAMPYLDKGSPSCSAGSASKC